MQQELFRREKERKWKRRVYKQKVRYEQGNTDLQTWRLAARAMVSLVMMAQYTPHHHSSEREGLVVGGFTGRIHVCYTRRKPTGRQIKTTSSGERWTTREKGQYESPIICNLFYCHILSIKLLSRCHSFWKNQQTYNRVLSVSQITGFVKPNNQVVNELGSGRDRLTRLCPGMLSHCWNGSGWCHINNQT